MQNWESMPQANYEHNWYGNMFSGIKREPMSATSYTMDHHNHHSGLQKTTASMDINFGSPTSPTSHHTQQQQITESLEGHSFYGNHPLGFNPLTPPGYPNAVIPQMAFTQELGFSDNSATQSTTATTSLQNENHSNSRNFAMEHAASLTPSHTPPMDITPPKSPKSLPATPEKDNEMSSNSNDSGEDTRFPDSDNDDDTISKPKFNSHGKVKKFKCKQCGYVAITKVDFWAHARTHIKQEKLLECHFCPFVTELKHHLEYHIRKHKNLKPFQCDQCSYTCVNKSMLNSHLKSHSKVYQYRCADCDYATKYCHSFKLHLRKYTHKPGMVLNEDGTPNPMITIDVYGTRRGPKMKGRDNNNVSSRKINQEIRNLSQSAANTTKPAEPQLTPQPRIPPVLNNQPVNMMSNLIPSTLANMLQQSRGLPFFPYLNLNLQMFAAQQQAVLAQMSPNVPAQQSEGDREDERMSRFDSDADEGTFDDADHSSNHNAMDLTRNSPSKSSTEETDLMHAAIISVPKRFESPTSADSITDTPILSSTSSKLSRRKGRAFKLDSAGQEEEDEEHDAPVQHAKLTLGNFSDDVKSAKNADRSTPLSNGSCHGDDTAAGRLTPKDTYECKSCGIYFRDAVLHTIHMGYHSCDDEFKCNMCGEKCGDRLTFFVHIARFPHS